MDQINQTPNMPQNPPAQGMGKKLWLIVVLIAVLVVLGFWLTKTQKSQTPNNTTAATEDKNDKEVETGEKIFK